MIDQRHRLQLMRSGVLIAFLSLALFLTISTPAVAGEPATWEGEIDGYPVWITVVPRGHEIPPEVRQDEAWWNWGNTTTDAYLFAFDRPENVRVILTFEEQINGLPLAKIYVNDLGSKQVQHRLIGDDLSVLSNDGFPYVTMRPEGGAWLIGGRVNYNLGLDYDGYGLGKPDGMVDWVEQVGEEQPGVPGWSISSVMNDPEPDEYYLRFEIGQRMADAPPFKVATPTMPTFPYLGIVGRDVNYFEQNRHPFYYSLMRSEFISFSFIGMQSGQYRVLSGSLPPDVDFEAPFVWYNFDPESRYPQLAIRAWYYPPSSPVLSSYALLIPGLSTFRYSWKTWDERAWAYSISVAGPYAYDQLVEIGGIQFKGVPPEQLPDWVVSKAWPITTFVEPVEDYYGGEGVYYYSTQVYDVLRWFVGAADEPPEYLAKPVLIESALQARYDPLPVGFRGEFNASFTQSPLLYLSPIDGRLHLLYAQGGVWNLGNGLILRVHNLNGDAYLDGWTRERVPAQEDATSPRALPGAVEEAFYAINGYLIYSGPDGSVLQRTEELGPAFVSAPPTDRMTWLTFRENLEPYLGKECDPLDLRGCLSKFTGPSLEIRGGKIGATRMSDSGFDFTLDLEPGFSVKGSDWLQTGILKPGRYIVSYDGVWATEPAEPSQLDLEIRCSEVPGPGNGTLVQVEIEATNRGFENILEGTIAIDFLHDDQPMDTSRWTTDIPSGDTVRHTLSWLPSEGGQWRIQARLEGMVAGIEGTTEEVVFMIPEQPSQVAELLLSSSGDPIRMILSPLFLLLLLLFIAVIGPLATSSASEE